MTNIKQLAFVVLTSLDKRCISGQKIKKRMAFGELIGKQFFYISRTPNEGSLKWKNDKWDYVKIYDPIRIQKKQIHKIIKLSDENLLTKWIDFVYGFYGWVKPKEIRKKKYA